jgi:hypothetical protein
MPDVDPALQLIVGIFLLFISVMMMVWKGTRYDIKEDDE